MYPKHKIKGYTDMILNEKASENIKNIINNPETDQITISAEGEPFNKEEIIRDLLNLSSGGRSFQILTNGVWTPEQIESRFYELNSLARTKKDNYCIRISMDSYHGAKIENKHYVNFFSFLKENSKNLTNIDIAIRGLFEDKNHIRSNLVKILEDAGIKHQLKESTTLDDELITNYSVICISYKNMVKPFNMGRKDAFSMVEYVSAIEKKYGKQFTLGNLKTKISDKGLDITIKPDGNIFFYGAEIESFGNVFRDEVTIEKIKGIVNTNQIIHSLYEIPFKKIMFELNLDSKSASRIKEINNPYWLVRELYSTNQNELMAALEKARWRE
jgi:hypothetical protein